MITPQDKNPFEGLSEENSLRMYVYLTKLERKFTSEELYRKFGYMPPFPFTVFDVLEIASDIAKNGVIINRKKNNSGCLAAIIIVISTVGAFVRLFNA